MECLGYTYLRLIARSDKMMGPKSIVENNKVMSQELKDEAMKVKNDYLWNEKVSAEEANEAIKAFNAKWMAAGGSYGSTITLRNK
jgi:hypothetical protein